MSLWTSAGTEVVMEFFPRIISPVSMDTRSLIRSSDCSHGQVGPGKGPTYDLGANPHIILLHNMINVTVTGGHEDFNLNFKISLERQQWSQRTQWKPLLG